MNKKHLLFILPILMVGYVYYERSPSAPENKNHKTVATSIENINKVMPQLQSKTKTKTKTKKESQQELDPQLVEYQELWKNHDTTVPVKEYLAYLLEEVNNQNADAQYHLTHINRYCNGIPKTEERLEISLARNDKKRRTVLIRDYEFCEGYNVDLTLNQVIDFIIIAARNGSLAAKSEFPAVAFPALSPSQAIARAEEIIELKKESMGYLHDIKKSGWDHGLYALGRAYTNGNMIEQDYEEAYAYFYAYHLVSDKTVPTSQLALDDANKLVTLDELNRAIIKGEQYANCCK